MEARRGLRRGLGGSGVPRRRTLALHDGWRYGIQGTSHRDEDATTDIRILQRSISCFDLLQVKSSQVKSSQVKSSQIQYGGRLSASFGALRWRERSGGQISAQPAPLDSTESGHHPHIFLVLNLIIAAPQGFNMSLQARARDGRTGVGLIGGVVDDFKSIKFKQ